MLNQAALQRKTSQKEAKQSKEFLKSFRKRQEAEETEIAELAREGMRDMYEGTRVKHLTGFRDRTNCTSEGISKGFSKKFNTLYSGFMEQGSQLSQLGGKLDSQPLRKEGQQVLSLCHDVLRYYKSIERIGKGASLDLESRSQDRDKKDVLDIIDKGKQLGEKIINASVSPSAGDRPLAPAQPVRITDELVASFFEKSLSKTGEDSWSKGAWSLWMALDKVVKRVQEGGV